MSKEESNFTLANSFPLSAEQNRENLCAAFAQNSEEKPYAFASYSNMNEAERSEFLESINTTKVNEYGTNILNFSPDEDESIIKNWFIDQTGGNSNSASIFIESIKKTRDDVISCLNVNPNKMQIVLIQQGDHNDTRYPHKDIMDEGYRVSQSYFGERTQFAVGDKLHLGSGEFKDLKDFYKSGSIGYNKEDIEGYVEAGAAEVAAFRTSFKGAVHVEPETKGSGRLLVLYTAPCSYEIAPKITEDLVQKSTQNFTEFVESQESYQDEVRSAEVLNEIPGMPMDYPNLDDFKSLSSENTHNLPRTDVNVPKLSNSEITNSSSSISNNDVIAAAAFVAAAFHASGAISMLRKASRAMFSDFSSDAPKAKKESKGSSRGR